MRRDLNNPNPPPAWPHHGIRSCVVKRCLNGSMSEVQIHVCRFYTQQLHYDPHPLQHYYDSRTKYLLDYTGII